MKQFFLALLFSTGVFAHQSSVTNSGKPISLVNPNVEINLLNSAPLLDIQETKRITENVLVEWNRPSSALNLKLTDKKSVHQIEFTNKFSRYGSGVVGITELIYSKEGSIQKATIKLNTAHYFSEQKNAHVWGGIYLGDILSHELGHLIGLNHSEVMGSTMFFESFPGQETLSSDDVAGVRTLYSSGWGRISGVVMGGQHVPVLGAQVKGISRLTGEAVSTVTNENGYFQLTGLDLNDSYYLYVSPTKRVNDLPSYFANTQNNFCPTTFKGGFFTACGISESGSAQSITLKNTKRAVNVGIISINCSLRSSPEYAQTKLEEDPEPLLIWDSLTEDINEKTQIGYFFSSSDWSKWDKFRVDLQSINGANKRLRINLVTHPLASSMEYELQVIQDGVSVANLLINEDLDSQTYNNNLSYELPLSLNSSQNDFEIHIRARNLSEVCIPGISSPCRSRTYPALDQFVGTQESSYLLSLGLMENSQPLFNTQQVLSDNNSCLEAPFTYRVSRNIATQEEDRAAAGEKAPMSCGTIEPPSSGPPAGGLFSLCLGFILAGLSVLLKKTKNTLS